VGIEDLISKKVPFSTLALRKTISIALIRIHFEDERLD
jgi:hypothetical protein